MAYSIRCADADAGHGDDYLMTLDDLAPTT